MTAALIRLGVAVDPARIRLWSQAALTVQTIILFLVALGTHGILVRPLHPTTTDFVSFYAAGQLADGPQPNLVYDHAAHYAAEQRNSAHGIGYVFFFYPPTYLLLCGLLSHLPYLAAFFVFEVSTTLAVLFVLRRILGGGWWQILPALSFSPLIWNFGIGQNACLTAALFGGGLLLLHSKRPAWASLLFACLCYKPHFGLLLPLAFAAARDRRAILATGSFLVTILVLTFLVYGIDTWSSFWNGAVLAQRSFSAGAVVPWAPMIGIFGAMRMLGAGAPTARVAEITVAILASFLVWRSWRTADDGSGSRNAVLVAGTLLVVPVALFYDLVLGLVAASWMIRTRLILPLAADECAAFALLWLAGLFCYPAGGMAHVPVGTLCAIGLFAMALRRQQRIGAHLSNLNN